MSEDAAISAAVHALLAESGESVADLAYHTRISVASLYRKLGGQASWKAADLGAVARHYGVMPGDLFRGPEVTGRPPNRGVPGQNNPRDTRRYLSGLAAGGPTRPVTPRALVRPAA